MTSSAAVAGTTIPSDAGRNLPIQLPPNSTVTVPTNVAIASIPTKPPYTGASMMLNPNSQPRGGANTPLGQQHRPPRCITPQDAKIPDSIDSVDSALLSALRDSRERLGLLKLEQVMLDFMNSSDTYWDVGGPFNSVAVSPTTGLVSGNSMLDATTVRPPTTFQRCILHRLADRFGITRDTRVVEGYIRLCKQPDSRIPKNKLLDLDPSGYNGQGNSSSLEERMENQLSLSSASNHSAVASNPGPVTSRSSRPRKMKIMKRSNSNFSSNGSLDSSNPSRSNTPKSSRSLSDKEKAYAEARARIFAEADGDSSAKDSSTPETPLSSDCNAPSSSSSSSLPVMATGQPLPATTGAAYAAEPVNSGTDSNPTTSNTDDIQEGGASSTRLSKATWRNRQSELNDPDFQRTAASAPAYYNIGYGYSATSANTEQAVGYSSHHNHHQPQGNPYYSARPGRGYGQQYPQGSYPTQYNSNSQNSGSTPQIHSVKDFPSLR